jgi:hypothetical protein
MTLQSGAITAEISGALMPKSDKLELLCCIAKPNHLKVIKIALIS